jgi:hypothetical protein
MDLYLSFLAEESPIRGVTVLAASFSKETAVRLSMDFIGDFGGPEAWMDIHKKDDKPTAEEVYTKRDFTMAIWILKREMDA